MTLGNLTSYVSHIWDEAPDCRGVLSRPRLSWKCENSSSLQTSEEDFVRMRHIVQCGGPLDPAYINALPRPEGQGQSLYSEGHAGLYPFEEDLLSRPPLWDPMLATDEGKSSMQFLNSTDNLTLGDTVVVKIVAKDGYG